MENVKSRLWGLDALRLLAAFFVVCQHIQSYWGLEVIRPVSRTAVILFFMISGYFLYDENKAVVGRKCIKSIKIISCIYGWALLIYVVEAFYVGVTTSSYNALIVGPWKLFTVFMYCASPFFPYGYHLWFLVALIEALFLIALSARKINIFTSKWIPAICVFLLYLGVFITKTGLSIPLKNTLLIAMPSIVLGGGIRAYKLSIKFVICMVGILLCAVISVYESLIEVSGFYYVTILLSVFIFFLFMQVPSTSLLRQMAKAGANYSLGIYIIHPLIIDLLEGCECLTDKSYVMNPFFIFLISCLVVLLYSKVKVCLNKK